MEENSATTEALVDTSTEVVFDAPPAAAAEDKKPEPNEGDPPASETTEQQEARKQSKFQRRLERQKTARIQAETEARLLRERVATLEAQSQAKPGTGEPQRDQFESYEAYIEARADWRADQKVKEALDADRKASQAREQQGRQSQGMEQVAQSWTKRETEFQATAKDYLDVVTPFVEEDLGSFSQPARAAIVESDIGPQVLYHLAQNPDEAERIAALSPVRQVAELGKIEVSLSKAAETPAPAKVSKAPAPITPVKSGRSTVQGFNDNMSDAEYREWRKNHGARWAR